MIIILVRDGQISVKNRKKLLRSTDNKCDLHIDFVNSIAKEAELLKNKNILSIHHEKSICNT